jgi:hypothetical protein
MFEDFLRFDKKSRFLFVDFETENLCLNKCYNKPWQMAILAADGSEVAYTKDVWIKWPDLNFSKDALAMAYSFNKKKMEDEGVSGKEALKTIKEELNKADYLVGHNILGFDIYILKILFDKEGEKMPELPTIIDTLPIARGVLNNITFSGDREDLAFYQYKLLNKRIRGSKTKLSDLAKHYDISYDESRLHDGIYDLELNLKVWNKLKFEINV